MKKIMLSILSIFFCLGALVGGGLLLTGCDSPSSQTQPLEPGGGFDESQNENNAENDENLGDDNFAEATDVERTASVSFNANGGTGAPLKVSKTTDIYVMTTDGYWSIGLSIPIKQPTRSGYTFTSWNTSSNGSGSSYSPGGTIRVGGSRSQTSASDTLYAQWKYTPYTITFNSNGCPNGTMDPIKKASGESVQLTPNCFWWGNDDYQFVGWATSPFSGTVAYENYGWYSANSSITLYAIWDYTIRFDGNGATSGSMSTQTKRHTISLKLNANNYKRTGYTFLGWSLTPTGSVQYSDGGSYTRNDIATFYAVWEPIEYTNTYYYRNTSGSTTSTTQKHTGTYTTLTSSSINEYVSNGWELILWGASSTATNRGLPPGYLTTSSSGGDFYALSWRSVSISYNTGGGSSVSSTSEYQYWNQYGNVYSNPSLTISSTVPTRSGYKFLGWSTSSSATTVNYDPGDSYTFSRTYSQSASVTLYAVWERLSYNLTINFAYNYGTYNVSLRVSTNRGSLSSSSMSEGGSVTLTSDGTTSTHTVTIRETSPSPNYFYVGTSTTPTSLTSYSYNWTPTSNKSIDIYTEQRYSITYNGNGNTGGSTSTTYYRYGTGTVASCGYTRTGYDFAGWATSSSGGVVYDYGDTVRNSYLTLYAVWTPSSYTNRYYYRNTSGGQDSTTQTRYYNSTYTLLSSISDDYESNGWSLYAWGSSRSATSGSSPGSTTSSASTSTIEYYAISRRTVSVSFSANGGKFSSTPSSSSGTQYWNQYGNAYSNPKLSITSAVPTRTGYEFLGWSTSSTATSADYVYGSTYTFSNGYSSSATKTLYAVWEAKNPAYYDSLGGYWYVENGKLPQSKVSDSLKSTLSGRWSSLTDGPVYYMGVEELANSEFASDGGMQSKVYNGNEYVKFNGEYYLVEPIRWRLVYSSSQQEGYAVENTSVLATMAEIVFLGSYSSTKIGVGAGYSAESVTMLLKNQVSDDYLVSESREVEIFGAPKATTTVSGSVFVASMEELANFTANKNNTTGSGVKAGKASFSDFVKDYLRATGQGEYYFTRDLGNQLNSIFCFNPVGNRSQVKAQQTLGVQFTVKVKEFAM